MAAPGSPKEKLGLETAAGAWVGGVGAARTLCNPHSRAPPSYLRGTEAASVPCGGPGPRELRTGGSRSQTTGPAPEPRLHHPVN